MTNRKIVFTSTLAALCLSLSAQAGDRHAMGKFGSNSLSDEPRSASAPAPIISKNAAVEGPMDTLDTKPGFAATDSSRRTHARQGRAEWREDRTVYRSDSPSYMAPSGHSHYAAYGDDLASLKGIQLELALNHLHHMNQSQIGLAKMAESKAKTETVLNLAHQIRADHERLEKKLESIADSRNVSLQRFELNTYEKVVNNRLNRLAAPEFETAFLRVIDRNHEMAAADLRMIQDDIADSQVSLLIDDAIPTMQAHKESSAFRARAGLEDGDLGE